LNEEDGEDVLFVSVHGYGGRDMRGMGAFYPGSGQTRVPAHVGKKEKEEGKGEEAKEEAATAAEEEVDGKVEEEGEEEKGGEGPLVLDVGMGLVDPSESVPGTSRVEWRKAMRAMVIPKLAAFKPDIIFISAGFDAHRKVRLSFPASLPPSLPPLPPPSYQHALTRLLPPYSLPFARIVSTWAISA